MLLLRRKWGSSLVWIEASHKWGMDCVWPVTIQELKVDVGGNNFFGKITLLWRERAKL